MEAGVTSLRLLITNLGALPEVCGETVGYFLYVQDKSKLSIIFAECLQASIEGINNVDMTGFKSEKYSYFHPSWEKR